jgi:RNA polymerase sigma-70 factor (family 1)
MYENEKHSEYLSETSSFKNVFTKYYPSLCYFAEKMVQDTPAAEDIVEEVFLKLWQKEPDFSRYKNIKALLYISVKNACLNFISMRRRSTQKKIELAYLLFQETETFALTEIIRSEVIRELYEELQKLSPECRNVMQLIFVEGWENKKIAAHLGITASTVRNHQAKGIKQLRKKFGIFYTLLPFLF